MSKDKSAQVFHFDLYGKREDKYGFLIENDLESIEWKELDLDEPSYFFVKKDFSEIVDYEKGFKIDELFLRYNNGIETGKDAFFYSISRDELIKKIEFSFKNQNDSINKYEIINTQSFHFLDKFLKSEFDQTKIHKVSYRPFDLIYSYFDPFLQRRPAYSTMRNMFSENIGLLVPRQVTDEFKHVFISKYPTDSNLTGTAKRFGSAPLFPLYIYPETNNQLSIGESQNRVPNLNMEIVNKIAIGLGLKFVVEKTSPTPPKEGLSFNSSPLGRLGGVGYITANPLNYKFIKEMRDVLKENPTEAEKVMWEYLRNSKTGHKIRRQHIVDDFITDFVCLSKKLVIEIDGKIHDHQKEYDALRTKRLNVLGFEVIRFTNEEVFANPELVTSKIKEKLDSITPPSEGHEQVSSHPSEGLGEVAPIDLLDYIYAVLHSPAYREKYKEFLKIDFPRVPYPTSSKLSQGEARERFWQLVKLGGEIRQLHLLESPETENYITKYPVDGDNIVDKPHFIITPPLEGPGEVGVVYINDTQYFADVPICAWEFYIGGYQPAQKWLKDRKGRELSFEDIMHYQKIIVALKRTGELMKEIDEVLEV
ncbi:MAG: DUF559 domain-containing protein [Sphingobacteriales bacterium]|nr:DUF559 domain-containing protein [Sphingobacteriales bacterium]